MDRYIVFIKDMAQNKEFTVVRQAGANQHAELCEEMADTYRFPQYVVHTAYTEAELKNVLLSVERWCGPQQLTAELQKREANAAKIQQELAEREEWNALTAAYQKRQQETQKGVQATATRPAGALVQESWEESAPTPSGQAKPATFKAESAQ